MSKLPSENFSESAFPHGRYTELTMYEFGHQHCKPGYTVRPFSKQHYLFHYIYSGKGRIIFQDDAGQTHEHILGQDQGFMICPKQVITYIADEKDPWQYAWVEFNGLMAKELVMKSGLDNNNPIYDTKDPNASCYVAHALISIVKNKNRPHLELMGRFYMFISMLIESSAREDTTFNENHHDALIQKAIAYICHNFHNDTTINEIAEYCNVHRSYLYKIFKNALNTTPQQFLINYRIKRACELLVTSTLSISEISLKVGYPNPINFSRAFKREVGQSPQQWKKASAGQ